MTTVIVFGPTGNVGSRVALTAHELGAKVALAMRDTSKALPSPLAEQEKTGHFQRVQADLVKPDTVAAAVKATGATRAYIYNALGTEDFLKGTLEALKSAGVTFVVFLSTIIITGRPNDISPDNLIAFAHRQVEQNIETVFGEGNWAFLRPGSFITNLFAWHPNTWPNGPVRLFNPNFVLDSITPDDMGDVSAALLVNGVKNGQPLVPVLGPEILNQYEIIERVSKGLGRKLETKEIGLEENKEKLLSSGIPPPIVDQLNRGVGPPRTGWEWLSELKQGVANVELYTGRPGVRVEDWVAQNKQLFS